MEFRVLGTVEVLRDGEVVDLGSYRHRALTALLLTAPNTVFSTDKIIDALWGDGAGADRQNALWVYVSELRKALEPDRKKRSEGTILLTRAPGYLIQAGTAEVDAFRFERLLAEGRSLTDTDPAAASLVLGEALALWRGRPFEEFTYEAFAQAEITRLEGLRLQAVEARIDADLMRGLSRELVSELETLVREHPLQERLTGQLMLALYRSGRQADALRSYQSLRSRLGHELGIEPSLEVRRIEESIVTGDANQAFTPRPGATVLHPQPGLAVRGYELRARLAERDAGVVYRAFQPSVGREVAIKVIRPELANDPGFIRRFEAEAQLVARLEHPHIVPLYDFWREPNAAYVVMRLMAGGTLSDVLSDGPLSIQQATLLVQQLGSALDTAHRAGVVHGNLSPMNVLFDSDGNAYLSDFAIATVPGHAGASQPVGDSSGAPDHAPDLATSPATDVHALAVVMMQALLGAERDARELRDLLAPGVREVIEQATSVYPQTRHDHVLTFVHALLAALGSDIPTSTPVIVDNPYKGLQSFGSPDAGDFFGRERLVARLIARIGESSAQGRFIAVVGPSGSGKSSVVRAGVLPALRNGAVTRSEDWFTVEMNPAPNPYEELEAALLSIAVDPPTSLLEELATGANGLTTSIRRTLPDDGSQLVLLIDQFEELFTQVDGDTSQRFLNTLANAITDAHSRLIVIVTLRADFYDRPLQHRAIGELLRDGTEIITPMTPSELERAISGPVQELGVTFEPAVVAELVHDVIDRESALPLLQFVLTELFDRRRTDRITSADYQEVGGASRALAQRADGLFAGLPPTTKDVTRQVFLRLVTLGDGASDTRRRVPLTELEHLAIERRELDAVLDTFGRNRLLSFDRDPITRSPTVEISHEALLSEWGQLQEWIDAARSDLRNQNRLAQSMGEWIAADRTPEYLLRGGHLDQLHGWARSTSLPLSAPEQAFLDASVAATERALDAQREREQRAIDAEQREHKRGRQLAAAVLVTAIVAVLAVFGAVQWRAAERARAENEDLRIVNSLASASSVVRSDNPELALLLAAQSVRESAALGFAPEEAIDAIHWAIQELGAQYDVAPDTAVAVRPGPNGPSGVYALSPAELVGLSESLVRRRLASAECDAVYGGPCPDLPGVPDDLPLRLGMDEYGAAPPGPAALEGARIRLASGFLVQEPGFELELQSFSDATGIEVDVTRYDGNDIARIISGNIPRPDILVYPGPHPDWVIERSLDLGEWLDHEVLRSDFGDYLLNSATIAAGADRLGPSETASAVPITLDLGGMVFYPRGAFEEAGYEIPATWGEMMALSHEMVAEGYTPWCMGFNHTGTASYYDGWPGADLIESLVGRAGGVDVYDSWAGGEIGFTSPEVLQAARLANDLVFEPGFTDPAPAAISEQGWDQQLPKILEPDPDTGVSPTCWFNHQRSWMLRLYAGGAAVGEEVDYFLLPAVDSSNPPPTIGTIIMASGLSDRPEIRLLLEYMADPSFGSIWATFDSPGQGGLPSNGFLAPNRRFDTGTYGPTSDPAVTTRLRMLNDLHTALDAGMLRGGTTEVMPASIGGLSGTRPNAFYSGVLDWVDGSRTIEEVFADIDAEWKALRARGGA